MIQYLSLGWWIWSEVCEFSRMQASALQCGAPKQFRGCISCQDAMVPFPRSSPGHPNHDVRSQPGYQLPSENATQLCRTSGSGMDLKVYAKSPTVLKAQIEQTFSALLQWEPFCVSCFINGTRWRIGQPGVYDSPAPLWQNLQTAA